MLDNLNKMLLLLLALRYTFAASVLNFIQGIRPQFTIYTLQQVKVNPITNQLFVVGGNAPEIVGAPGIAIVLRYNLSLLLDGYWYIGQGYNGHTFCVDFDSNGLVYVGGTTSAPIVYGQANAGGPNDAFVGKYYPNGTLIWGRLIGTSNPQPVLLNEDESIRALVVAQQVVVGGALLDSASVNSAFLYGLSVHNGSTQVTYIPGTTKSRVFSAVVASDKSSFYHLMQTKPSGSITNSYINRWYFNGSIIWQYSSVGQVNLMELYDLQLSGNYLLGSGMIQPSGSFDGLSTTGYQLGAIIMINASSGVRYPNHFSYGQPNQNSFVYQVQIDNINDRIYGVGAFVKGDWNFTMFSMKLSDLVDMSISSSVKLNGFDWYDMQYVSAKPATSVNIGSSLAFFNYNQLTQVLFVGNLEPGSAHGYMFQYQLNGGSISSSSQSIVTTTTRSTSSTTSSSATSTKSYQISSSSQLSQVGVNSQLYVTSTVNSQGQISIISSSSTSSKTLLSYKSTPYSSSIKQTTQTTQMLLVLTYEPRSEEGSLQVTTQEDSKPIIFFSQANYNQLFLVFGLIAVVTLSLVTGILCYCRYYSRKVKQFIETADRQQSPEITANQSHLTQITSSNVTSMDGQTTLQPTSYELSIPAYLLVQENIDYSVGPLVMIGGTAALHKCKILRSTAIKSSQLSVIKKIERGNERTLLMFRQEVSILYQLRDCDFICKMLAYAEEPQYLAFIMPYYQHGTLEKYALKQKSCMLSEMVRLLKWLAVAIDFVHRKRYAHCDIKTVNVLLDKVNGQLRPILADFGLARVLDPTTLKVKAFVVSNINGASYSFASPDVLRRVSRIKIIDAHGQVTNDDPINIYQSDDVYAFAITMMECLIRRRVYEN